MPKASKEHAVPPAMSEDPTIVASSTSDRRGRARYAVGLPVRVHIEGLAGSMLAELSDVSATGCFLRSGEITRRTAPGDKLAFGFVLPSLNVGLVRGRVVRSNPGDGLGVIIEQANAPFDELLGSLAHNDKHNRT